QVSDGKEQMAGAPSASGPQKIQTPESKLPSQAPAPTQPTVSAKLQPATPGGDQSPTPSQPATLVGAQPPTPTQPARSVEPLTLTPSPTPSPRPPVAV